MGIRALRNALNSIVPNWLSNRRGLNTGFKVLYTAALMGDVLLEQGLEGLRAPWPGKGTPSALPLIGQSRGIIQGEAELESHYAVRLQQWLTTWLNAGSTEILAQTIQSYLGNDPTVRIVDRAGNWVTANPDGTTSLTTDTSWDWDEVLNPERDGWWSDIWIIITPAEWAIYTGFLDPAWTANWGTGKLGLGHKVSASTSSTILSLVATWKGAHVWVENLIWVLPSNNNGPLFVPGNLGLPGNPDGTWGHWSKNVGGVQVPARTTVPATMSGGGSVRYWEPTGGG